jgi:acyl-CoA thioester hydrolase
MAARRIFVAAPDTVSVGAVNSAAAPRSGTLGAVQHRFPIRVRFYELDPYHHVNHAVYIQYFEAARIELLREAGMTLQGMMDDGVMIVVTDITTRFLRSALGNDELVVETEVLDFKRVTSRWRQRLLRGDEVIVEQELGAAVTNSAGRPIRFPEHMVAMLRPYLVGP